ncbi:hypothetical protein FFLO_01090 [Filobasidium floriforme]|uniref:Uncharacterized protein n=1 Tax=Filobasidium floriforme TaxID=5210 RepID=A0A8K0JQB4_9TREE|nr:uncharacterized protein HD553DRAFT_355289 [Filobasidium floriforme]KAG7570996.1 hypothetical protein FFLO_01090 [Filobasidium floriforme]KAH8085354.1 hypothetical protein HD553DRAFT_355289 [Filobasidium floriforme]
MADSLSQNLAPLTLDNPPASSMVDSVAPSADTNQSTAKSDGTSANSSGGRSSAYVHDGASTGIEESEESELIRLGTQRHQYDLKLRGKFDAQMEQAGGGDIRKQVLSFDRERPKFMKLFKEFESNLIRRVKGDVWDDNEKAKEIDEFVEFVETSEEGDIDEIFWYAFMYLHHDTVEGFKQFQKTLEDFPGGLEIARRISIRWAHGNKGDRWLWTLKEFHIMLDSTREDLYEAYSASDAELEKL